MKKINKEIGNTFVEMDRLMGILYFQFKDITSTLSKVLEEKKNLNSNLATHSSSGPSSSDDLLAKVSSIVERSLSSEKDIQTRLDHLFNTLKPPLNDEKKLRYSFYKLQEMLTKIVNELPGLVNEKGEMNQELLTLLTNFLAGVEKLKNGEEKQTTIPVGENSSYWLVSLSEKKQLEDKLAQERSKSFQLKKKSDSLEADIKNQLKKWERIGQQIGSKTNKIKNELASISGYSELSAEELDNYLTELWEIKKMRDSMEILLGDNEEWISKKTIWDDENEKLNKILDRLELEGQLRDARLKAKQLIAGVLAGEWTDPEKRIVMDKKELLNEEYSNYPETLDKMNDLNEIYTFEAKMLQTIAKHRSEYYSIDECLSLGERALKYKGVELAKEALQHLSRFRELQLAKREKFDDYDILLKKANEFHALKFKLLAFLEEQEKEAVAQIEQPTK